MFGSQISELCIRVASAGFLHPLPSDCAIGCGQKAGTWKAVGGVHACLCVCVHVTCTCGGQKEV